MDSIDPSDLIDALRADSKESNCDQYERRARADLEATGTVERMMISYDTSREKAEEALEALVPILARYLCNKAERLDE